VPFLGLQGLVAPKGLRLPIIVVLGNCPGALWLLASPVKPANQEHNGATNHGSGHNTEHEGGNIHATLPPLQPKVVSKLSPWGHFTLGSFAIEHDSSA
jgi:hypothetical protein